MGSQKFFRAPATQHARRASDIQVMRSSRSTVNMQRTMNLILAAVVLLLFTKNVQSQDFGSVPRALGEFQRECTSKPHTGHFRSSASLRYDCLLPNGDTATALTVEQTGDDVRVIGIVYQTHGPRALERVRMMNWLSLSDVADDELIRRSRGSDGCVFAEWRGSLATTVLLRCAQETTITRMLHFPENARSSSVENHQN